MASTYTDNIRIEKITTGEKAGEWGDITNNNFDRLDIAINGLASADLGTSVVMTSSHQSAGGANTIALGTSTVDEAGRNQFIEFTAAASPNTPAAEVFAKLESQDAQKVCYVRNSTGQTLTLFQGTHDSNNDVSIASGKDAIVKFDGNGASAVVSLVYNNPEIATLTTSGNVTIGGDLTISGDDLTMGTNTSGHILVADGTNYNPVAVSGDITLGSDGAAAIASGVIVNADINASAAIADTKLATISSAGKVANSATTATTSNTANTIVLRDGSGNIASSSSGNAATATALETARTIGGVSFDGTANIDLPGVNTAGNQDTTGNAATATASTQIQVSSETSSTDVHYVLFSPDSVSSSTSVKTRPSGIQYYPNSNTLIGMNINTTGSITSDNYFEAYNSLRIEGGQYTNSTNHIRGLTTSSVVEIEFDTITLKNYSGDSCIRTTDESGRGKVELYYDNSVVLETAHQTDLRGSKDGVLVSGALEVLGTSGGTSDPVAYMEVTNTPIGSGVTANTVLELSFAASSSQTPSGTDPEGAFFLRFTENSGDTQQGVVRGSLDGSVTYATSSDERLKEDIQDAASQWELIRSLNVRDYSWKKTGNRETGFIAQELYASIPKVVDVGGEDANQNPWSVDYGRITPFLVKALQEAMDRIEELEDRLNQVS